MLTWIMEDSNRPQAQAQTSGKPEMTTSVIAKEEEVKAETEIRIPEETLKEDSLEKEDSGHGSDQSRKNSD